MYVCIYVYIHTMCRPSVLRKPEKSIGFAWIGVTSDCELPCVCCILCKSSKDQCAICPVPLMDYFKNILRLGMMVYPFNPNISEAEAGGSLEFKASQRPCFKKYFFYFKKSVYVYVHITYQCICVHVKAREQPYMLSSGHFLFPLR